jgi:type IV pilus assembly protein PilV
VQGFTLVEVLVALVVMTVGMLGIAVLYVEGLRMNRTSINRTVAVSLTTDMAERISSNSAARLGYAGEGPGADNGCVNGINVICTPQQQAADDWYWWLDDVQEHLPVGVSAQIDVGPVGSMWQYEIQLQWPEAGQAEPARFVLPLQL